MKGTLFVTALLLLLGMAVGVALLAGPAPAAVPGTNATHQAAPGGGIWISPGEHEAGTTGGGIWISPGG